MEQNQEMTIGKIIHNKLPVEWMRLNMFFRMIYTKIYRCLQNKLINVLVC